MRYAGFFVLLGALAGCGGPPAQVRWNTRFATEGGRGLLIVRTQDIQVAERATLRFCGHERTELLAESAAGSDGRKSWRAVYPLTPALEACLAREPKVEVGIEGRSSGWGAPERVPLDEWSAERIAERVHARELAALERATAVAREQDPEKYLSALRDFIRRNPRSFALEQAQKEVERVERELAAERKAAEEKARAEAAARKAEEERRARVQAGLAEADAALRAQDPGKAMEVLDRLAPQVRDEAERDAVRRLKAEARRTARLGVVRAKYAPRVVPRPRRLYLQRKVQVHELPDAKSAVATELDEGEEVWGIAAAGRAMVGVARTEGLDAASLVAAGAGLHHVEGWVDASALTPKDRWATQRLARLERERALVAALPQPDQADARRLMAAGPLLCPRLQVGLYRKGYEPAETSRAALLLDATIRAAENAEDPRTPAVCAGLAEIVRTRRLPDCSSAARLGASDESVAALVRDFGRNVAGFASLVGIASEELARTVMAVATGAREEPAREEPAR